MSPIIRAGQVARFKLVSSEVDAAQPMVVNYSLGGTAAAGVDYAATATGQITIPAGARQVAMPLQTMTAASGRKTLVLTIMPGNGYTPGRANAVVRILSH
jgi:hypothetical protein